MSKSQLNTNQDLFSNESVNTQKLRLKLYIQQQYKENDLTSEVTRTLMTLTIFNAEFAQLGDCYVITPNPSTIKTALTENAVDMDYKKAADMYISKMAQAIVKLHKASLLID